MPRRRRPEEQEWVVWQGAYIFAVVEADTVDLASIRFQQLKTGRPPGNITPLKDFRDNSEGHAQLNLARRQCYERKIKRCQEVIQAAEKSLKQAKDVLRKLEMEALVEQVRKDQEC